MKQQLQFNTAYISFGGNLPFKGKEPSVNIKAAMQKLDTCDLQFVRCSSMWNSPAWPDATLPEFTNAMAIFISHLTPLRLMNKLLQCENAFGRDRSKINIKKNAPRTMDIDLISYGQMIVSTPKVQLPHPRAYNRAFVLLPLQEIDPFWVLPGSGADITSLVANLNEADKQLTKVSKPAK